jgi:hypothetical protein
MKNLLSAIFLASGLLLPQAVFAQTTSNLPPNAEGVWIFHANLPPQAGTGSTGGISYAGTTRFSTDGSISGSTLDQHTGASFGVWVKTGYRDSAFTFLSDTYDSSGNYLNTNRIRGTMTVSLDGLSSTGTTLLEILDKTGKVIFTTPATSTFTGMRLTVLSF